MTWRRSALPLALLSLLVFGGCGDSGDRGTDVAGGRVLSAPGARTPAFGGRTCILTATRPIGAVSLRAPKATPAIGGGDARLQRSRSLPSMRVVSSLLAIVGSQRTPIAQPLSPLDACFGAATPLGVRPHPRLAFRP